MSTLKEFFLNEYRKLQANKLLIKSFIKEPISILFFILFLFINSFLVIPYFVLYSYFILYYLIKLMLYHFNIISELKPKKYNLTLKLIPLFLFVEVYLKAYLNAYNILYTSLNNYINKKQTNKLLFLTMYIYNFLTKFLTGFSKKVIINSFFWSLKIYKFEHIKDFRSILYYDIIIFSVNEVIYIEDKRIYRTKKNKFNFNPSKIKKEIKLWFCQFDDNLIEQKKINFIIKEHKLVESIKVFEKYTSYREIASKKSEIFHSTTILNIFKNKKPILIGLNQTTKPTISGITTGEKEWEKLPGQIIEQKYTEINTKLMLESIMDPTKRYLTKNYFFYSDNIKYKTNYNYDFQDTRRLAVESKINQILIVLSSYLYEDNYYLELTKDCLVQYHDINKKKKSFIQFILENPEQLNVYDQINLEFHNDLKKSSEILFELKLKIFANLTEKEQFFLFLGLLKETNENVFLRLKNIISEEELILLNKEVPENPIE